MSGDEIDDFIGPVGGPSPLSGNEAVTRSSSSDASDQAESDGYRVSAASSYIGLQQIGIASNASFDDLDVEKLLAANTLGPVSRVNSFNTGLGMSAGVDGVLEAEQSLGLYTGGYSDSFLSSKDMMVAKTAELSVLPSAVPPIDDSDFLWMAPWSSSVQTGPPPSVDHSWSS